MRSSVIAFLLCAFAAAAMGQCVAPGSVSSGRTAAATSAAAAAATTPAVIMVTPTRPAGPKRPGAELITAAGAVTHGVPPVMQPAPHENPEPDERDRPAGPAMLLAALALMSGIALRRYNARNQ
jgi:hypothetical protein